MAYDHPRGEVTIERGPERITILINGEPWAWGSYDYADHMEQSYRRYKLSSQKPLCIRCGHSYELHLAPSGFDLEPVSEGRDGCNWGGGLEGCCHCGGYKPAECGPQPAEGERDAE